MDRLIGIVFVHPGPTPLNAEQSAKLKLLGRQAGLAFGNALLFRERLRQNERMYRAEQLATMGEFAAGIAHELNNPLNNISMTAESLLEDYRDLSPEEADEMLRDILNQAERASQVVKNLLEFSRTERPFLMDLNVKDVIEGTIRLVKNQIMVTGIELDAQIADPLPTRI